jgi:hypothetical protein
VAEVVALWERQAATGISGLAEVCTRFLKADGELRRSSDYDDPQWWRGQIHASARSRIGSPSVPTTTNASPTRPARGPQSSSSGKSQPTPRLAVQPTAGGTKAATPLATLLATLAGPPATPPPEAPESPTGAAQSPAPAKSAWPSQAPPSASDSAEPTPSLAAPASPSYRTSADGLVLHWQASATAPAGVTYVVEREAVRGEAGGRGETTGTSIRDDRPPVGRTLVYRIWATHADSGGRSKSVSLSAVFAPPVTELFVRQVQDGSVHGRWRAHPDLLRVEVHRTREGPSGDPDDTVQIPAPIGEFHDQPLVGRHVYSVVPHYRDRESGQIHIGPTATSHVPVFDPPPELRLAVDERLERGSETVTVRWGHLPAGVSVLLRRVTAEPSGATGDLLTVEEVGGLGEPVIDGDGLTGTAGVITLPAGLWTLVPFAIAGHRAVRGGSAQVLVIPPVTSPEVVRNGAEVLVSWVWPEGLRLARVTWCSDSADSAQEITHTEYQRLGGVAFRRSEAAEVRITGLLRSGAEVLVAEPVTVQVLAQPPTLTYHVRRAPHASRWSSWRRVTLVTDRPCVGLHVEIYLHSPTGGTDSDVVLTVLDDVDLGPANSREVRVKLPGVAVTYRPFYVSCRATAGADEIRVDPFRSSGREIR